MKTSRVVLVAALAAFPLLPPSSTLRAQQQGGDLAPAAPPGVTMKSLDKIDPGTALDPADAPFTISVPGSYYLTGNVTTVPATQAVITISTSNVTVDLRGFSLISSGGTGTTLSHSAIRVSSASVYNVTVRNGHIDGNWYAGFYGALGRTVSAENLKVRGTSQYGIYLGGGSRVIGCHVDGGAALGSGFVSANGIQCSDESLVVNSTARRCDGDGIQLTLTGGAILDCTANDNLGNGIDTGASCTVSRCVSAKNVAVGIRVGFGCVVSACVSYSNDGGGFESGTGCTFSQCAAYSNIEPGFQTSFACFLSGCSSYLNTGDGFFCASQTVMTGCVAFDNTVEGFDLASNHVVTGCISAGNDDNGFSASNGTIFSNCVARSNGQTAVNNAADGFQLFNDFNRIRDCLSADNFGAGIRAILGPNDIRDNTVFSNDSGGISVTTIFNLVIGNYASSNASFNISPAPAAGGNIGPLEDGFSGTSPNANFQ